MICVDVTLTALPQSVAELVQDQLPGDSATQVGNNSGLRMNAIIQSAEANGANVQIGSINNQSGYIVPGGSGNFEKMNLNTTYLRGAGLVVYILLMD